MADPDLDALREAQALLATAKAELDPIFAVLREAKGELPASTLRHHGNQLGGWLPTLGEKAGEWLLKARVKEAVAEQTRAGYYRLVLKAHGPTAAYELGRTMPEYRDAMVEVAKFQGIQVLLQNYHDDTKENQLIIRAALKSQGYEPGGAT
jgi:hypothetical protein